MSQEVHLKSTHKNLYPDSVAALPTIWILERSFLPMQSVEGRMMLYLRRFSRFLLTLPAALRLWIVILSTVVCQTLFILLAPIEQNPSILAIPVVLAAWFYRRPGTLFCLGTLAIASWAYYAIHYRNYPLSR